MKKEIFNQYVTHICKMYHIGEDDLFKKTREQDVVDARHMLFYLCFNRPMPIYTIKNYMAERGLPLQQSAIVNGVKKLEKHLANDPDYSYAISTIEKLVKF
jgi:chromosomal replication initiation ATPase DnaA